MVTDSSNLNLKTFFSFLLVWQTAFSLQIPAMAKLCSSLFLGYFLCFIHTGLPQSYYAVPIKIFAGQFNWSPEVDLVPLKRNLTENGLSLASSPAGVVHFLNMVNNLKGDSGRGYYMEMLIGTPPQSVS